MAAYAHDDMASRHRGKAVAWGQVDFIDGLDPTIHGLINTAKVRLTWWDVFFVPKSNDESERRLSTSGRAYEDCCRTGGPNRECKCSSLGKQAQLRKIFKMQREECKGDEPRKRKGNKKGTESCSVTIWRGEGGRAGGCAESCRRGFHAAYAVVGPGGRWAFDVKRCDTAKGCSATSEAGKADWAVGRRNCDCCVQRCGVMRCSWILPTLDRVPIASARACVRAIQLCVSRICACRNGNGL